MKTISIATLFMGIGSVRGESSVQPTPSADAKFPEQWTYGLCRNFKKIDSTKQVQTDFNHPISPSECEELCMEHENCKQANYEQDGPWGSKCWFGSSVSKFESSNFHRSKGDEKAINWCFHREMEVSTTGVSSSASLTPSHVTKLPEILTGVSSSASLTPSHVTKLPEILRPIYPLFMCNFKRCDEWMCEEWCECDEHFPLLLSVYEKEMDKICPSDGTECECPEKEEEEEEEEPPVLIEEPKIPDEPIPEEPRFPWKWVDPLWDPIPHMMVDVSQFIVCGDWVPTDHEMWPVENQMSFYLKNYDQMLKEFTSYNEFALKHGGANMEQYLAIFKVANSQEAISELRQPSSLTSAMCNKQQPLMKSELASASKVHSSSLI